MKVQDYDGDGKDELVVITHIGSGTGVAVDKLSVIKISEDKSLGTSNPEYFKEYIFEDYLAQLDKAISFNTYLELGELIGS